jgi:tetratricopeptide (TPR) repeat protein
VLALAPRNGEALYLNGLAATQMGELQKARSFLEQAVIVNADSAKAHFKLGQLLTQLNDFADAEKEFKEAIRLGQTGPEVRFALAMALRSLGQASEAKEQLQVFEQMNNEQTGQVESARKSKAAEQAIAAGDPAQAVALYRDALHGDPDDALLMYKLAMALDKTNDTAGEQAMLEQAVERNPNLAEAQNQLGYLAVRRGDTQRAVAFFHVAVQAAPSYTIAWINLAASLASEARWQEAMDAVERALAIAPNDAKAQQLKAAIAAAEPGQ